MSSSGFLTLESSQAHSWLELIQQCEEYDIYHLPFYHALARSLGEGEPLLFYFKEGDYLICLPLLVRPIAEIEGLGEIGVENKDATSVYGYAGPVASRQRIPQGIVNEFQEALASGLRDLQVVSLFSRLHPILENHNLIDGLGEYVQGGATVSVDTSISPVVRFSTYRRNHRVNITKLRTLGLKCREADTEGDVDAFVKIYNEAMRRVGAGNAYFFPRSWYADFLGTSEAEVRLLVCHLEGKVVCGGLVTICKGLGELHIAATADEFVQLSPLKLLFDYAGEWSGEKGARVLHLGGGVGAKADSLYRFKTGFSTRRHLFHMWHWILNQHAYDAFLEAKNSSIRKQGFLADPNFFPAYRAPLLSQEAPQRSQSEKMEKRTVFTPGVDQPSNYMINTLFTSVGRRVELIRAFRNAYKYLRLPGRIVAIDVDPLAPALSVADRSYVVPPLSSPDYIPRLVSICRSERIRLVFPLIDPDIPLLAQHRAALEETGAEVVVVPEESVAIAADKWRTHEFFQRIGVPEPKSWLVKDLNPETAPYPLFIKPRQGSAGKDSFKVDNAEQLLFFGKYVPDPIIEEFLPGPEITNDVLCDLKGNVLAVVSRKRIEVRSGEVAKGVTIYDESIMRTCVRIAEALQGKGQITVQCIIKNDTPYFTEINARYGGGTPLGIAAGCDSPRWLLAEAAGLPVATPGLGNYKLGLYVTRFDESFFLTEGDRDRLTRGPL